MTKFHKISLLRSPERFENSIRNCYFYASLCSGILRMYFKLMASVGFLFVLLADLERTYVAFSIRHDKLGFFYIMRQKTPKKAYV